LGTYDPLGGRDGIKEVRLQTDRVKYWIGEGAELTDTVSRLLSEAGLLPRAPARLHTVKCKPKEKGKAAGGGAPAKAAVSAKVCVYVCVCSCACVCVCVCVFESVHESVHDVCVCVCVCVCE
jgi:ribosomal protein S16